MTLARDYNEPEPFCYFTMRLGDWTENRVQPLQCASVREFVGSAIACQIPLRVKVVVD